MNKELILKLASLTAATVVVLALATCTACNTANTSHVLDNLQGCARHYDGTVSAGMTGGQFAGTVKVDCAPTALKTGEVVTPAGNSTVTAEPLPPA